MAVAIVAHQRQYDINVNSMTVGITKNASANGMLIACIDEAATPQTLVGTPTFSGGYTSIEQIGYVTSSTRSRMWLFAVWGFSSTGNWYWQRSGTSGSLHTVIAQISSMTVIDDVNSKNGQGLTNIATTVDAPRANGLCIDFVHTYRYPTAPTLSANQSTQLNLWTVYTYNKYAIGYSSDGSQGWDINSPNGATLIAVTVNEKVGFVPHVISVF